MDELIGEPIIVKNKILLGPANMQGGATGVTKCFITLYV